MKKLNILFMGTPDFSVPCLDLLKNHSNISQLQVVSMPDRVAGRGKKIKSPEVIEYCKQNKVSFFQTENINKEEEFLNQLEKQNIDIIIVLAFAQFLGERILNLPKIGCFNIHTSLLPKYRGAAPIQYAILNGDKSTGVSIQRMVKKMDAGDLCHSEVVSISNTETGGQLYTRLKFQAALALNNFLDNLIEDRVSFTPQDENQVSFAPSFKKNDGKLDFNRPAKDLFNQVRALYPWPGTFCHIDDKKLKVLEAEVVSKKEKGFLTVQCSNQFLRLKTVQLEGKKPCSDVQLLNGYRGDGELK